MLCSSAALAGKTDVSRHPFSAVHSPKVTLVLLMLLAGERLRGAALRSKQRTLNGLRPKDGTGLAEGTMLCMWRSCSGMQVPIAPVLLVGITSASALCSWQKDKIPWRAA